MQNTKYPMVKSEYDRVWRKYCGFLDLSVQQFMSIQEALLRQQLEQVAGCSLGRKLIGEKTPRSVEEFRHSVPLTTYEDYTKELVPGIEGFLPEKPHAWAYTSGADGCDKRAPYTFQF